MDVDACVCVYVDEIGVSSLTNMYAYRDIWARAELAVLIIDINTRAKESSI